MRVTVESRIPDDGLYGYATDPSRPMGHRGGSFCVAGGSSQADSVRVLIDAPGHRAVLSEWAEVLEGHVLIPSSALSVLDVTEARVKGFVVGVDRQPIAGALVELLPPQCAPGEFHIESGEVSLDRNCELLPEDLIAQNGDGPPPNLAETRIDGGFELRFSTAGVHSLFVFAGGHEPQVLHNVDLEDGMSREVLVVLQSGVFLTGDVYLSGDPGRRPRGVIARLAGKGGRFEEDLMIDPDSGLGQFRFDGVSAGKYILSLAGYSPLARENGHAARIPLCSMQVELSEAEAKHLVVHLGSGLTGGRIEGVASLPHGVEPEGVAVFAFSPSSIEAGPVRSAWLGAGGRFLIPDAPAGDYIVLVIGSGEGGTPLFVSHKEVACVEGGVASLRFDEGARLEVVIDRPDPRREFVELLPLDGDAVYRYLFEEAVLGVSSAQGVLEVFGLPAGGYSVRTRDGLFRGSVVVDGLNPSQVRLVQQD